MKILKLSSSCVCFLLFLHLSSIDAAAQNYDYILNYSKAQNPVYGVKIKTNLPFTPGSQMPTISIKGYNYDSNEVIDLTLVYYVYSGTSDFYNPVNYYFHNPAISSAGGYTPSIKLANEGGKVVIFINDKRYYQRFTVSAFAQGLLETAAWFQGWTAVDEALTGTAVKDVVYKNRFQGDISMPGAGIWNTAGNVGIGTATPKEKLSVNGKIRAHEIKVETSNWPDFVFEKEYEQMSLKDLELFIQQNKHLPDVPAAAEVNANGVELGNISKLLLQKIEELTMHLIEKNKEILDLKAAKSNSDVKLEQILKRTNELEKRIGSLNK